MFNGTHLCKQNIHRILCENQSNDNAHRRKKSKIKRNLKKKVVRKLKQSKLKSRQSNKKKKHKRKQTLKKTHRAIAHSSKRQQQQFKRTAIVNPNKSQPPLYRQKSLIALRQLADKIKKYKEKYGDTEIRQSTVIYRPIKRKTVPAPRYSKRSIHR